MCSVKDNIKSSVIIVLFVLCELCVTLDHEYSNEIAEMLWMSDIFCYYAIFTKIIHSVFEKWNADFNNDKLKTLCNYDIKIKKFSEKM